MNRVQTLQALLRLRPCYILTAPCYFARIIGTASRSVKRDWNADFIFLTATRNCCWATTSCSACWSRTPTFNPTTTTKASTIPPSPHACRSWRWQSVCQSSGSETCSRKRHWSTCMYAHFMFLASHSSNTPPTHLKKWNNFFPLPWENFHPHSPRKISTPTPWKNFQPLPWEKFHPHPWKNSTPTCWKNFHSHSLEKFPPPLPGKISTPTPWKNFHPHSLENFHPYPLEKFHSQISQIESCLMWRISLRNCLL